MQLDDLTRDRLLMLCDYMESLPEEADRHFRMRSFLTHTGSGHKHDVPEKPQQEDLLTCGTAACALGWGTTMPEFQVLGLHFKKWASGGYDVVGTEAVFPGLSGGEDENLARWAHLFEGFNKDETPKAWAVRARNLIEEWSQPGAVTTNPYDD